MRNEYDFSNAKKNPYVKKEKQQITINLDSDIIAYFKERNIEALGISSFGPLNLDENSPEYGNITTTPKPGWKGSVYELLSPYIP